jgi:hypothetical protein
MSPELEAGLMTTGVAAVIGLVGALISKLFGAILLRIKDNEDKVEKLREAVVTKESFKEHRDALGSRLDRQDKVMEENTRATNRALGILERWARGTTPPSGTRIP